MTASALITGGAGFIGSHLAEALLTRGWAVSILDDLSTGRRENLEHLHGLPLRVVEGSVLSPASVEPLVADADVVFHLAATVGVDLVVKRPLLALTTNIVGTQLVLEAAGRHGKKVVLTSTSEIYGKSEIVPYAEGDDRLLGSPASVRWGYSTSKAAAECFALAWFREHRLPIVVARLFNTIGPRQRGRYGMVVPRFVSRALAGRALEIYGDGMQRRCFCHVRDVVDALIGLAACDEAAGEVFNVGSSSEISIRDLAILVLKLTGVEGPDASARLRLVPYREAYGEEIEDMRRRKPDIGKIRRVIGWRPRVTLEEALLEIVAASRS